MGLISDLIGRRGEREARTIADVEAAISRLNGERELARGKLAAALQERERLLLVDGSEKRIGALEAECDAVRLTLERCERAEPLLLVELTELRSAAKQKLWAELRDEHGRVALAYAELLRAAVVKRQAMLEISDRAGNAGFGNEAQAYLTPPHPWLNSDAVGLFVSALERSREMPRPLIPREAAPAQKHREFRYAAMPGRPSSAPASKQPAAPPPPPKPKAAAKPAPPPPPPLAADADGNAKVVVLRPGIELADGRRPRVSDVVSLPFAQAEALLRNGAADTAPAA